MVITGSVSSQYSSWSPSILKSSKDSANFPSISDFPKLNETSEQIVGLNSIVNSNENAYSKGVMDSVQPVLKPSSEF